MSKSHRNIRLVWEEENRETNFKRKFVIAWKLINEWFVEIGSANFEVLFNGFWFLIIAENWWMEFELQFSGVRSEGSANNVAVHL